MFFAKSTIKRNSAKERMLLAVLRWDHNLPKVFSFGGGRSPDRGRKQIWKGYSVHSARAIARFFDRPRGGMLCRARCARHAERVADLRPARLHEQNALNTALRAALLFVTRLALNAAERAVT